MIRLRFTEPDLERPFRVPGNVRIRGTAVPVAALVGAPLTFAIWIAALLTHDAARIAGPIWLASEPSSSSPRAGPRGERLLGRVTPAIGDLVPDLEGAYERILVPMKLGLDRRGGARDRAAARRGAAVLGRSRST